MFVVRRPFRDSEGLKTVGTIVVPAAIQRFRYRLGNGYIVEVTEQNFDKYVAYFRDRHHVDIRPKQEEKTVDETAEEAPVKAAVKATAKAL